jgi:hypothetical protein
MELYDRHLDVAAAERIKYYKHNAKAKLCLKYLSVIIDGMTQNTTRLPHQARKGSHWEKKKENTTPFYETHVMGVLSFEKSGTTAFCEMSHQNLSNNSSLVLDSIHRAVSRSQAARVAADLPLPSVLYLQLDNVSSNKSKVLFLYCSWLVMTGVFEKVKVGFLMVGHTHENTDQLFSRIAKLLKRANCHTMADLERLVRRAFTPSPATAHVTHVNDWVEYLTQEGNFQDIRDISFNHQFKIEKDDAGDVVVRSKQLSTDAEWSAPGRVLFSAPDGVPAALAVLPLVPLKLTALLFVRDTYKRYQAFDWKRPDVRAYWDTAIAYQEGLASGIQPTAPSDLYCHLSTATGSFAQLSRHSIPAADVGRFQPVRRDIYVGRQRPPAEREAAEYLQDSYMKVAFEDMYIGSIAILKASAVLGSVAAADGATFRLKLNRDTLSEPLLLARVASAHLQDRTVAFEFFKPLKFTHPSDRSIARQKATTNGCFQEPPAAATIPAASDQTCRRGGNTFRLPTIGRPAATISAASSTPTRISFSSSDIILGWDLEDGDDATHIPIEQHQSAITVLRAQLLLAKTALASGVVARPSNDPPSS